MSHLLRFSHHTSPPARVVTLADQPRLTEDALDVIGHDYTRAARARRPRAVSPACRKRLS